MITVCIFDAKTNLSNLMKKAQKGEIVISLRGETRRGRAVGSHPFGCKGEDWSSRNTWICFTDASLSPSRKKSCASGMETASEDSSRHAHTHLGYSCCSILQPRGLLAVDVESALRVDRLVKEHSDPFNRMISAQAHAKNTSAFLSADAKRVHHTDFGS